MPLTRRDAARRLRRGRAGPCRRPCVPDRPSDRRPRPRDPLGPGDPLLPGAVGRRPRSTRRRSGSPTRSDSSSMPGRSGPAGCRWASECATRPACDALRTRAAAARDVPGGDRPRCPAIDADLGRFEAEVRTAGQAGARVSARSMLSGRRYETFATADAFRRFAESSSHSLKLAAPVAARLGVLLAVENHKDWRADELLAILKRVGNDHVGICLDTGNSIALLEDPMDVIEALRTLVVHDPFQGHGASRNTARGSCSPRSRSARASSTCPAPSGSCEPPGRISASTSR